VSLLVLALALAAIAAVAAALALTGGGSGSKGKGGNAELRTFVTKIENFLGQSHEGRREVSAAVNAAVHCKLTPRAAAVRLNGVQRNRQSLLQQIAALAVPSMEEALRASDLLQQAAAASIAADGHYYDWLLGRSRCGPAPPNPDLHAAWAADAKATRLKKRFLVVFDPLARRFGQRVWRAAEF
jgi:hypothetical protein